MLPLRIPSNDTMSSTHSQTMPPSSGGSQLEASKNDLNTITVPGEIQRLAKEARDAIGTQQSEISPASEQQPTEANSAQETKKDINPLACVLVHEIGKSVSFDKLALELRTMIWNYSLPERRVVRVDWYHQNCSSATVNVAETEPLVRTNFPAALWTCQESRQVALRKYTLKFQAEGHEEYYWIDPVGDAFELQEWFDYQDESRYRSHQILQFAKIFRSSLDHIRRLVFDQKMVSAFREQQFNCLKTFKALKNVIVIVGFIPCRESSSNYFLVQNMEISSDSSLKRIKRRWETQFPDPHSPQLTAVCLCSNPNN